MDLIDMTLVAQSMANYYGVSVEMKREYDTAVTEFTTSKYRGAMYKIQLPMIGGLDDTDAPILRGYLDHEVGHVKFTDFERTVPEYEEWKCENVLERRNSFQVYRQCFNIIEDVRIERLMMRRYPGSVYNLKMLNRRYVSAKALEQAMREIRDTRGRDCSKVMTAFMQTVLTLAKGILHNKDREHDEICATAMDFVDNSQVVIAESLASRAAAAETDDDVYRIVNDMMDAISTLINDYAREQWATAGDPGDSNEDDSGAYEEDLSDNADVSGLDSFVASQWAESSSDMKSFTMDNPLDMGERAFDGMKLQSKDSAASQATEKTEIDSALNNYTVAQELSSEMRYRDLGRYAYRDSASKRQYALGTAERHKISMLAARMYNVFVSTLETVTYVRSRSRAWGTRPDMAHLYRPACMDGRVFRTRAERQALDTSVSVLLDLSGSMAAEAIGSDTRAQVATVVAHGMVSALRKLPHVDAALYVFKGELFAELGDGKYCKPDGGTPTALALMEAQLAMSKRAPHSRKIIFVVTDGEPDHVRALQAMVVKLRRQNVEVVGIEICNKALMEQAVGKDFYVFCEDMMKLPAALMQTMRNHMERAYV